jgi:hypothetical protein
VQPELRGEDVAVDRAVRREQRAPVGRRQEVAQRGVAVDGLRRASGTQGLGRQRRELGPPLVRSPVVAAAQVAGQPRITIRQAFPSITPRARAAGRGSLRRSL